MFLTTARTIPTRNPNPEHILSKSLVLCDKVLAAYLEKEIFENPPFRFRFSSVIMADRKADYEVKSEKLEQIRKEMIEEDKDDSDSKSGCEHATQIGKEQDNLNMILDENDSGLKFDYTKSRFEQTEYRFEQEKGLEEEEVREEIIADDEEIERQQKHSMEQLLALHQQQVQHQNKYLQMQQQMQQNLGYSTTAASEQQIMLAEGMGQDYADNNQSGSESDPKSDVEDNFSSGSSNSEFERIDMPANDDALDQDDDDKASFEVIDEEIGEINSLEIQDFNKINVLNFKSTDVNDDQIFANDSEKVSYDEFKDKCEEKNFKLSNEESRKLLMNTGGRVDLAVEYLQRLEGLQALHRFEVKPVKTEIHQLTSYQTRNASADSKYPFIPEISTGIKNQYEKLCKEDNNKWNTSTNSKYPFIPEISTGIKTHYEKLCKEDNNKWNASTNSKYPFIPEISTGIKSHYEKLCKEDNNKWFMDSDRNGDADEEKQEQTTYELENAVGRNIFEIFLSFLEFNVYVLFFVTFQEAIQDLLINTGGRVDLAVEYLQRLEGVQPYFNNAVGRKAYIQVNIFLKYSSYFFYFSNLMYSIFSG